MSDIKIMLIDDDEEGPIRVLSERLEIRDFRKNTAFDSEQVIKMIRDQEPDIMILDLKISGIDGMEVLRRVRMNYPDIRVIIQTAHGNDMDEAEARQLGVFDYLKKPVDVELLAERIRAAARSIRQKDLMAASAFAEAGEHETARTMMKG
ncbi:MAG: response regulator [Nitrospirae bacterium]|nr:MAG: response regulator [Nitrospirota bacterium]